ncbi:hypothetical protein, conserved [Plasmodium gonderi]|uniref:Uncharacterized protein n=1 Tax=Plasmodium gonderi TaxID=77519 RepID=A0A1Y1JFB2_PLAGO|nr:hypothetical protein, conserved [Plasmodium gonderi]GAW79133.1 hypothetical protein, conserved [Plasmodium gonderi]
MSNEYNLSIDLKRADFIKENLKIIRKAIYNEFHYFCSSDSVKSAEIHTDELSKSRWNNLYASWRMEDFTRMDIGKILNILRRNQYVMVCIYFLLIFTFVYLLTLILYTKCFRRLIKAIRCKTCKRKKKRQDEKESENKDVIENVKKRLFNIITYIFLSSLLCVLISVGIWYINNFLKTKNGIYLSICNASISIENFLTNQCPNNGVVDSSCYSLEHIMTDVSSIVEEYQDIKLQIKKDLLIENGNNQLPILTGFVTIFENLKKLQRNIRENNKILEDEYFHTYPVLTRLGNELDSVIQEGEANFKDLEESLGVAKDIVKEGFEGIDNALENKIQENIGNINDKIVNFNEAISHSINKYKIKRSLKKYITAILIMKLVLLIPPFLVLVGLIVFIYFLIKGDVGNARNFFLDLFGAFSAYFGFLTIVILSIGIITLSLSVLGGATCTIADRVLKNELTFDVLNDTLVDYCLKNENAPLISEDISKGIIDNFNSFHTEEMEKKLIEYDSNFNEMKKIFNERTRNFVNYIWVVITKQNQNRFVDNVVLGSLRKSLLAVGITRDNIKFGKYNLWGTDEYFEHLNRFFFSRTNLALCFENSDCENQNGKFNINFKSSINDDRYRALRNQLGNDRLKQDLDNVVQLFIHKSRVKNEKMFTVSDLDSNITEKIGWNEYTPRFSKEGESKNFIIRKYLVEDINNLNFNNIFDFFEKFKNKLNTLKDMILSKMDHLIRYTNCSRLVTELKKAKHHYCDDVILNMITLSVSLIVFSIISFFLWYFFLFFWLYYHMKMR